MTAPAVLRRWPRPGAGPLLVAAAGGALAGGRRVAPWAGVLLTALAAHVAVTPRLALRGAAPDGLVVAVVAVAAGRGARAGAGFGFAAGLGADLFLSTPLGTSALAYTLVGHGLGRSGTVRPGRIRPGPAGGDGAAGRCRRSLLLTLAGVGGGQLAVAVVAAALGGVPFPGLSGLLGMAAVAGVSAPLGPPAFAAVGRLAAASGGRR